MSTNPPSPVPHIPDNAPFSEEQRAWLNGFLAGLYSDGSGAMSATGEAKETLSLNILFGSQTGNAEAIAKQTAKALKPDVEAKVIDMEAYDTVSLKDESHLLIITSTYGEGDPPDNAEALHSFLHSDDAPKLEGLQYSVLALGDTNYEHFCQTGKDFDKRLEELGATRIYDRVDCDVDYDEPYEAWLGGVSSALGSASTGSSDDAADDGAPAYGKKNPFPAPILNNYNLNGEGSIKETRHVEISLKGSGLEYEAGDALAVVPMNCEKLATEIISLLGFSADERVNVHTGDSVSLLDALKKYYDISQLNKNFMKQYQELVKSDELEKLIGDADALSEYTWGRQVIDLLIEYPHSFANAGAFLEILNKLQPRLYSISSSPKAHPDEVHVTVGAVRYNSHGRERKGVCSTFLADEASEGKEVSVYMQPNKAFKLPEDPNTPVIMVGPGTGIAPFRAFLEERAATEAPGKNWLFFGDQHAKCDFLYQSQIEKLFNDGVISQLDTAFSRDQEEKIYVQDCMIKKGAEIFKWFEDGAAFYICGDASRMAKDVDRALHLIAEKEGSMSTEEAEAYINKLKKDKRYLRDVY